MRQSINLVEFVKFVLKIADLILIIDLTRMENTLGSGNFVVTLKDVKRMFDDLINGAETRENIAKFSLEARKADDQNLLELESGNEEKIWKSILYFSGVDLPGDYREEYLESIENIINYRHYIGV